LILLNSPRIMRIAFIQDHLRNGGTENQTLHIAHGLASEGIETHVIVFRKGGILDDKADASAFHLHFLNQGPFKTDWFAPGLDALLRSLEVDIVIAMGRMGNCHAGLLCRNKRSYRNIATFRTGKTIPWLQRRALRKADHIIANSQEALARISTQYNIERPESTVIYNGCIRNIEATSASAQSTPIRLVSASMFRPEKKQQRLLRICKRLPEQIDWRLTLAGDGSERSACIAEAKRLGLADRVDFPGLLSDPNALYQESHIAVHASAKESLPNFLVEAQMAGLPVIAYNVGGVAETFLPDQSGILIESADEDRFVEALEKLAQSPDLRLQMSEAARNYARLNFTPKAQLQTYINLLNELISRPA
jgi:glycosyltransferase involved in cell wall biosynthesis